MTWSTEMYLINEALARAHCTEQLELAQQQRLARRAVIARRMERRAARTARRARRLAMAAVVLSDRR